MLTIRQLDDRDSDFHSQLQYLRAAPEAHPIIRRRVASMQRQIRRHGDAALLALTRQFDQHDQQTVADLAVSPHQLQQALHNIPPQWRRDLSVAAKRLRDYHCHQRTTGWDFVDDDGNRLGEIVTPVKRAMVYAPGGKAAYPSSVLMGVIPAVVAGVEEIILSTPAPQGEVSDITLAAAAIAGAHQVYLLGGAQAIIGFALGTETLPATDVIVGPGNTYVAEAKRQLFGRVGLDSIAGPSEVLIISDGSAPAGWIAADLAAQAEHDELAQSMIVSDHSAHLQAVQAALTALLPTLPRHAIIRTALNDRGIFIKARDMRACCQIANLIAAEHVQIMTLNTDDVVAQLHHVGGLFIGSHSCVPMGDYVAGPNHVLPTATTARFASPLGVGHFIKRTGWLQTSAAGANALAGITARLADAEGLSAHAVSARYRLADAIK